MSCVVYEILNYILEKFIMSWIVLLCCVVVILFVVAFIKTYAKLLCGRFDITQDLTEKIILITGASTGIGEITARELARHGATVHMLCRNLEKADKTVERIKCTTKNTKIHVWKLDTSKLESVRKFAQKYLATRFPIDVLINNAGILWVPERQITEDGLELTMATNHYGHFLLTNLLLEKIKKRPHARIVNVSSIWHWSATFDLSDINLRYAYGGHTAYENSKLANVLFTRELAQRLKDTGVTVNALHPGAVDTEIYRNTTGIKVHLIRVLFPFLKTPEEGAQTTLYLAVAPDVKDVTGEYFSDCHKATMSWKAKNKKLAEQFWNLSAKLTELDK